MAEPIELYFWPTPNGFKITIALEEMGLAYKVIPVNIGAGDQFKPDFLAISPNNRMPAIVDPDGPDGKSISVFESGAILQYLARKTGRFSGANEQERAEVESWLMWQMGGLGPMAGQTHHFRQYAPAMIRDQRQIAYGANRYSNETHRLYGVLNKRLADRLYVAGDYSIADMAAWPWITPWRLQGVDIDEFPNLKAWYDRIAAREAVQRSAQVGKDLTNRNLGGSGQDAAAARNVLFGQRAR